MSAHHDWLNLVEVSGPFLAVPVLREVFPQGLVEVEAARARRLRSAYEEWRDAVDSEDVDLDRLHVAWVDEVLLTALDADDSMLRRGERLPEVARASLPEHDTSIVPDLVLVDTTRADALLLPVHVFSPDTDLVSTMRFGGLASSPADRMALHLRAIGCVLGIVTNGERWMLVHAPVGQVATFASWYARIWPQEPETLRAFASLLGVRRFFGPEHDRLPSLFERSLKHQDEVTDALGAQVRRAVEVLVQALDRADQDRNRELLHDVRPQELYEAGLTVMMRLVFLLAAEERGLLLLGEPRYDAFYAASTLRMQLRVESDEVLERRRSAWSRLLAVFRAVYGGIDHPTLRLPAMGGSLFDPDRFPFLEGRSKGTSWRHHRARPLPIDDRTVLLLLDAIQTFEGRTLSYRALDVEQIGHVYEGLLERTVARVADVTLELEGGAQAKDPRVTLGELESARLDGREAVIQLLVDRTRRSESAVRNAIVRGADEPLAAKLLSACRGDVALRDRLGDYAGLLRVDPWGYPLVYPKDAFVVVLGTDRRESGTHYTPRSLTEWVVEETLTPLVYDGPRDRKEPRGEWRLRSPDDLLNLKVCDPAMGSGAFLVQACRFLAHRIVEAWTEVEATGATIDESGRVHEGTESAWDPLPSDQESRTVLARRLVAERCLYGVDVNPLAVELAKLSLWLTTMAKGRPFGFLDHNLKVGDSLVGVGPPAQLLDLASTTEGSRQGRMFGGRVRDAIHRAVAYRERLRTTPIRDIRDVEAMASLEARARDEVSPADAIAGAFIEALLTVDDGAALEQRLSALAAAADRAVERGGDFAAMREVFSTPSQGRAHNAFHWPLRFPEVFEGRSPGFDAVVGNPPFLNAIEHAAQRDDRIRRYHRTMFPVFAHGAYDLCLLFWARALTHLLSERGCYGLVAPTALLADEGPWKKWTHDTWRPRSVSMYPVDFFGKARIRTSAIVGARGGSEGVTVSSSDPEAAFTGVAVRSWAAGTTNWYETASGTAGNVGGTGATRATTGGSLVALERVAEVAAGCTTADAYNLKPEIVDSTTSLGARLTTTGAIDRYTSKWGRMRIRYLKDDYQHPRWPIEPIDKGVARALSRQRGPKILVGGLTAVVEAWFDSTGDSAGIVQTWVVRPRGHGAVARYYCLTGVLNAAYFSRVFVGRHGAQSMSGKQITVKKKSLLAMPVPMLVARDSDFGRRPDLDICQDDPFAPSSRTALECLLARVVALIQCLGPDGADTATLDKLAHFSAGVLYGRNEGDCEADYRWWCARCGVSPVPASWSEMINVVAGINELGGEHV